VVRQFNKHRSKTRSQVPRLESTSVTVTVWISTVGKRTAMFNAGDTAQLLPAWPMGESSDVDKQRSVLEKYACTWQGKVTDRWFVRMVCSECAEHTKALMWFVALRTLLFRRLDS
jgi:hypothetical protein